MAYDPINPLIPQQNPSLSNQGAFRFWVQTVLPTIYDDSLSYYELLNKVVQVLNAAISDVDALHSYVEDSIPPQNTKINEAVTKVNALGEQFDTLKGFVDNYFENLDVQDEINNKLNAMAADGTLTELIEGILDSSTAINQAVADWLEDYAETSGITAPAIDKTLSIANAAADAKVTGDIALNMFVQNVEFPSGTNIVNGSLDGSGGSGTTPGRARTEFLTTSASYVWLIYLDSDDYVIVNGFKYPSATTGFSGGVRITPTGTMGVKQFFVLPHDPDYNHYRLSFKRVSESTDSFTSEEIATLKSSLKRIKIVSSDLTVNGVPANAKTVGDELTSLSSSLSSLSDSVESQFTNNITYYESLNNTKDLDSIYKLGTYRWEGSSLPDNCPYINAYAGRMLVIGARNTGSSTLPITQMVFRSDNRIYYRSYSNNGWSDWVRINAIDDTLTSETYPASAKKTGDLYGEVKNFNVDSINAELPAVNNWYEGALISTGVNSATNRIHTVALSLETRNSPYYKLILTNADYKIINVFVYTSSGWTGITRISELNTPISANTPFIVKYDGIHTYLRVTIARVDDEDITDDDIAAISQSFKRYGMTDVTVSQLGVPADAYYTGQKIQDAINQISASQLLTEAQRLGLHTMPENVGQLNAVKNARIMTDIEWSPATDDIQRVDNVARYEHSGEKIHFLDKFLSGKNYHGMPYSERTGLYIGQYIDFDTWITSTYNKFSVQNIESIKVPGRWDIAPYYGAVCVHIPGFVFDIPSMSSEDYSGLRGGIPYRFDKVMDIYNSTSEQYGNLNDLKLGDVFATRGHVSMVTDLIKENDDVKYVEISENTTAGAYVVGMYGGEKGGISRRTLVSKEYIYENMTDYIVVRFRDIANVQYRPTPHYTFPTETPPRTAPRDLPILPYYGNRCIIVVPSADNTVDVKLIIRATEFSGINIYKNGTLISGNIPFTYSQSEDIETSYTFTCDDDEAEYMATLVGTFDGETCECYPCRWLVTKRPATTSFHTSRESGTLNFTSYFTMQGNMFVPKWIMMDYNLESKGSPQWKLVPITSYTIAPVDDGYKYTFTYTVPSREVDPTVDTFAVYGSYGEYGSKFWTGYPLSSI